MTTMHERFDDAAATLARQGIPLIVDNSQQTSGDAWCDAAGKHGNRIAFIHAPGGHWNGPDEYRWRGEGQTGPVRTLYVSFHYDNPSAGEAIVAVFAGAGFRTDWDGEPVHAVQVHLNS